MTNNLPHSDKRGVLTEPPADSQNPKREHVTDGGECWCNPIFEFVEGGTYVVIHRRSN